MALSLSPLAFIEGIGGPEMGLIIIIVLVLFGGKKLPEFARGLGKSIREFKKAASGVEQEFKRALDEDEQNKYTPPPALPAASSTPELKAVPMPIAEPIVIPETKAEPTQPAAPELPIPQARISSPNPLRSVSIRPPLGHLEKTKNPLPRIDPAKLSNVGQPASTQKLAEPPQLARR